MHHLLFNQDIRLIKITGIIKSLLNIPKTNLTDNILMESLLLNQEMMIHRGKVIQRFIYKDSDEVVEAEGGDDGEEEGDWLGVMVQGLPKAYGGSDDDWAEGDPLEYPVNTRYEIT